MYCNSQINLHYFLQVTFHPNNIFFLLKLLTYSYLTTILHEMHFLIWICFACIIKNRRKIAHFCLKLLKFFSFIWFDFCSFTQFLSTEAYALNTKTTPKLHILSKICALITFTLTSSLRNFDRTTVLSSLLRLWVFHSFFTYSFT